MILFRQVYATDKPFLNLIRKTVKKYQPTFDTSEYFEKIVPTKRNSQPLFIIGLKPIKQNHVQKNQKDLNPDDYQIMIAFLYFMEYRFSWSCGQCLHLVNVIYNPDITSEQINQFSVLTRNANPNCNYITFNVDKNTFKPEGTPQFPIVSHQYAMYLDLFGVSYRPSFMEELNAKSPEYKYRFLEEADYDRGLFEIMGLLYKAEKPTRQTFLKQLKKMKDSNCDHWQVVTEDRKTGKLVAFVSMIDYDTLQGKQGFGGNAVISPEHRQKKIYNQIIKIAYNEYHRYPRFRSRILSRIAQYYIGKNYTTERRCYMFFKGGALSVQAKGNL